MNVFELEATLTLKTTDYDRALSEAGSSAKDAGRSITDGFSGIEKEFENIGDSISDSFSNAFDAAESSAADAGSSIADSLADAGESFADAGSSAQEAGAEISDGMSEAGEETGNAGRSIKDVLSSIGSAFSEAGSSALNLGKSIVSSVVPGFNSIASAASGGAAMLGGLAGAAVAVGKGLVDAATSAAAFADDILTLSSTTGLSTDTLQEFKYMEDLIDVSVNTVASSMRRLTNNMDAAANGSTTASEAFDRLNVSVTDSEGHLRSTEEVFYAVITALGEVGNHAERDAIAMDLFGKSAMDLNPMIDAGSEKLAKLAQEAHEVGYVLSSEELSNLGGLQDSFDRLGKSFEALANNLGEKVAPAIQDFVDGVTGAMNNLNNALDNPEWASDMAGSPIVTFLSTLFGTWKSGAEDAEEATEEAVETLDGVDDSAQAAADAAAEFAAAWQDAFESATKSAAGTFGMFETAPEIVAGAAEQVTASLSEMASALESQGDYWNDYADNIRTAMERGVDQGLVQALSDGTAESARQLAQLATATDEEIANMNASYEEQQAAIENYASAVADAATGISTSTSDMSTDAQNMETAVTTATSNVESAVTTMTQTVTTQLQSAADGARTAGEMVGQGFAEGILSTADQVRAAAQTIADIARSTIESAMDIHSPSRVTHQLGVYTGEGYAEGIEDTERQVRDATQGVMDGVYDILVNGFASSRTNGDDPQTTGRKLIDAFLTGVEDPDPRISLNMAKGYKDLWANLQAVAEAQNAELSHIVYDGEMLVVEGAKLGIEQAEETIDGLVVTVKNREEAAKAVYDEGMDWLDKQVKYYDMSLADQIDAVEGMLSNFVEGSEQYNDLSDKLFELRWQKEKEDQENTEKWVKAVSDAQKDYVDGVEDFRDELETHYEEIENLQSEYYTAIADRTSALAETWGMFGEVTEVDPSEAMRASDIIANLKGQVAALEEYSDTLDSLAERGVGEDILSGLREAGPDNLEILRALNNATEDQLNQIVELYGEKFALAEEQATEELEPLLDETNAKIYEQVEEINRLYAEEAPDIVSAFDSALAEAFESGFAEAQDAALNAARGILDTIESDLGLSWNGSAFKVKQVAFADSAIGTATAATINASQSASQTAASGQPVTVAINLDGEEMGRAILPPLVSVAAANGTPITSDIYV